MEQELKAVDILLKRGVKVSITAPLFLRIITFGQIKRIGFTIRNLSLFTLLKIARVYLQMELKNTEELTVQEGFEILIKHRKRVSKIVAYSLLDKDYLQPFVPIMAYWLRRGITAKEMCYLFKIVIVYGGLEDFISTIRSAGAMRITAPMNLSPQEKTS